MPSLSAVLFKTYHCLVAPLQLLTTAILQLKKKEKNEALLKHLKNLYTKNSSDKTFIMSVFTISYILVKGFHFQIHNN